MSAIFEVLRQLDEWRHLPAYQLERRVDIFFGMFLPKVIEKAYAGVSVDAVIPEFPLHKGMLGISDDREDNQSVNVDFVAFGTQEGKKRVFLVELKTDMNSLNREQLERMKTGCVDSDNLLNGVVKAAENSGSKQRKYAHLVWKLLELASLCPKNCDIKNKIKNINWERPGLPEIFKGLTVGEQWKKVPIEVVVVLPAEPKGSQKEKVPPDVRVITFAQIVDTLEKPNEPFASEAIREFAGYLRQWASVKAGRIAPLDPYR